jgi:hypothetical protein
MNEVECSREENASHECGFQAEVVSLKAEVGSQKTVIVRLEGKVVRLEGEVVRLDGKVGQLEGEGATTRTFFCNQIYLKEYL